MSAMRWWVSASSALAGYAALTLSLSGCSVSSPSVAAEMDASRLRLIHVSPNSPSVDLLVGGRKTIQSIPFGQISDYVSLPGGRYEMALVTSAPIPNPLVDNRIASAAATVPNRKALTVLVINESSRMSALMLDDTVTPLPNQAQIRLVHTIPDAPPLSWELNHDEILFPDLAFGQVSTYLPVKPGFLTLTLKTTVPPQSQNPAPGFEAVQGVELKEFDLNLRAGKIYTLYATGLMRGAPEISLMQSEETIDP